MPIDRHVWHPIGSVIHKDPMAQTSCSRENLVIPKAYYCALASAIASCASKRRNSCAWFQYWFTILVGRPMELWPWCHFRLCTKPQFWNDIWKKKKQILQGMTDSLASEISERWLLFAFPMHSLFLEIVNVWESWCVRWLSCEDLHPRKQAHAFISLVPFQYRAA